MSSHADTIRRAMVGLRPSPLANGNLRPFAPPLTTQNVRDAQSALDALLAEIQRLREEIRIREESQIPVIPTGAQQKMDRLEDENQRLRDALEQTRRLLMTKPPSPMTAVFLVIDTALAGDAE